MKVKTLVLTVALAALHPAALHADDESMERAALVLAVSARGEADAGGTPIGDVHDDVIGDGQRKRYVLRMPSEGCVLLVAQGADFALEVALTVRGRAVARAQGRPAQVVHCPEGGERRAHLEVRAPGGRGAFAAAAFQVASEAAVPSERAPTSHAALQALVDRHTEGQVPAGPVETVGLRDGARSQKPVSLVAGSCYRVLAAGGPGVRGLHLELLDPEGGSIGETAGDGASATLGMLSPLCPRRSGAHALRLRSEGSGEVAWRVFRAAAAERVAAAEVRRAPPPVAGTGSGYVARALRARHGRVGEGMAALLPVEEGRLGRSETVHFDFRARPGHCYRVIAAAMPSVRTMRVRILDRYGSERGASGEEAQPTARFCPTSAGSYRVELKATNGYGAFALQLFESR